MKRYSLYLVLILFIIAAFSACRGDGDYEVRESMDAQSSIAQPRQADVQSEVSELTPNQESSQDAIEELRQYANDFLDRLPQEQTMELWEANNVPPGYLYLEGYDYISYPSEGMVWARKDGKVGFINADDLSEAIPCIYDSANEFSEGYAPACLDGQYGYIDKNNNVVVDFGYVHAHPVKNGIGIVDTFYRMVYESTDIGLNPSYTLFSYAVVNMENGETLHASSQIIKNSQENYFYPLHQLDQPGKYPVVAESPTVPVDINGYYATHDGSVIYQNESIYQAVEWSDDISFALVDVRG